MEFTNKKKLEYIKIQNDSLFEFIVKNDDKFKDMYNSDDNTIFEALKQENKLFKGIVTNIINIEIPNINNENVIHNNNEISEDPIRKFDTICNMEEMKRAFFNINPNNELTCDENYLMFHRILSTNNFHMYEAEYLYNSDNDGKPDFVAKNLLRGFVKQFEDYRKYFMITFRCYKGSQEKTYKYISYWIVNTNEPIKNIIGTIYDDFIFKEINYGIMLNKIIKESFDEDSLCLDEKYVH